MASLYDPRAAAKRPPVRGLPSTPPAMGLLAREMAGFAFTRFRAGFAPSVRAILPGDGRTIVVIPGFMASDSTTSRLRRSLNAAGFATWGWGMGRNHGVKGDTLDQLHARIEQQIAGEPLTLIGWSLGGLIAREFAKRFPERTQKVITLGSPFSGCPRANHAWRLYEKIAGHSVDAPPIATTLAEKPPVPTIAIWSPRDGIVSPKAARGFSHESDRQIRVDCSHMALVADPAVIRIIGKAILD